MKKFKQQTRKLTTLHDFAKNNHIIQQLKPKDPNITLKRIEQSRFGLSTLLHFNNNSTISSIRSKIDYNSEAIQSPQFCIEAKLEIQELKSKRLQLERKWANKQKKHSSKISHIQSSKNNLDQPIQNLLDQSQVQAYPLSLQKTKFQKNQSKMGIQDRFILNLKNQIKADKAKQFILKIKGIVLKKIISTVRKYIEIREFRQTCRQNLLKMIMIEWKQLSDKSAERQQLRRLIVQKIKKRKLLRELEPNIDNITF